MWSPKNAIMVFQLGGTFLYFREVLLHDFSELPQIAKMVTVHGFVSSPRCKIGGFFSLFALKGQNRLAQGNALGNEANKHFKP